MTSKVPVTVKYIAWDGNRIVATAEVTATASTEGWLGQQPATREQQIERFEAVAKPALREIYAQLGVPITEEMIERLLPVVWSNQP